MSPVADVADSVTIVNMSPVDASIVVDRVAVNFNYVSKTFVAQNDESCTWNRPEML